MNTLLTKSSAGVELFGLTTSNIESTPAWPCVIDKANRNSEGKIWKQ